MKAGVFMSNLIINFAVRSETGLVRTNNEDNFFCNGIFMSNSEREKPFFLKGRTKVPCIFGVCDGMGGEDCGEIASFLTVETLSEYAEKIKLGSNKNVNDFVRASNAKLLSLMNKNNIRTGTTLALVVIKENFFTAYNLGDSRIYRVQNKRLIRVTDDHTVAEDKVRLGLLTPKQAEKTPEKNFLTKCIGIFDNEVTPDVNGPYDFNENEKILICSDGLTDMLSYNEIANIILSTNDISETVNNLVNKALQNGGKDNVTCMIISF